MTVRFTSAESVVDAAHESLDEPIVAALDRDVESGGLLDIPSARRWFEILRWGRNEDVYTFQQPFASRSGPRANVAGGRVLVLSSYDYLGLIGHPEVERGALDAVRAHGTGTGGVRLLTGTTTLHRALEREIAAFKRTEAAITFTSGYAANVAVIQALFGPRDLVIADARVHRSVVDACRLARVPVVRFAHDDASALRAALLARTPGRRTLVVVEGVYSMDGDICGLPAIVELKRRHGFFLMIDEAHSFGVLGAGGRGVDEHFGMPTDAADIWMGALSKAVPANGGFVAGSHQLVVYLQHAASPFIFSSALCPPAAGAALAAIRVLAKSPWRPALARENAAALRQGLRNLGFDTGPSASPIVPVMIGPESAAYVAARELLRRRVLATAVTSPAVAPGGARLRLCATAAHGAADLAEALEGLRGLRDCARFRDALAAGAAREA